MISATASADRMVYRVMTDSMCRCPVCGGFWFFDGDELGLKAQPSLHPKPAKPCTPPATTGSCLLTNARPEAMLPRSGTEGRRTVSTPSRIEEEHGQIVLVGMYLILAVVMAVLMGVHASRARGARLGRWHGGYWV